MLLPPTWLLDPDAPGRDPDTVIVRLEERVALSGDEGSAVRRLLEGRPHAPLRVEGYHRVDEADDALLAALSEAPGVAFAYRAFAATPPPGRSIDPAPETPVFPSAWHLPGPAGLDVREGRRWPGGEGEHVVVTDVEYGWDALHEDLPRIAAVHGVPYDAYAGHGTAVLGIVGAPPNLFGMTGGAPRVELRVAHPMNELGHWLVADAIVAAAADLVPGDVILVEQQAMSALGFVPVSVDPAVFEAIRDAVGRGIVVVEAAGNGGADLDDPFFEGWFDQDSGSLLVGAAEPGGHARIAGSNHGAAVDVHAWGASVVAPADGAWIGADLFYPNEDPHQAYTSAFGGTSGASAQIAAVVAQLQSIAIALHGAPVAPEVLGGWLRATGWPGDGGIGAGPDVRVLVRTYLSP